ncbi:MAG: sulfurtransferase [Acidimicrobiales bacterium]
MINPFVPAAWLAEQLTSGAAPPRLVVADVRWYLDGRSGPEAFEKGHLPGALWVDLDRWLSRHGDPSEGRHPLPDPARFAEGMDHLGIGPASTVIAYDDQSGTVAGRLVWMLRRLGVDAAMLDGGLAAWPGPLEMGSGRTPGPLQPGGFPVLSWPAERLATTEELRQQSPDAQRLVVDARAAERYRGETEPIDPVAGHVPGAENLPLSGNLGPDGCYLPRQQLAERYAHLRDRDVVMYCGSGVSACHNLLALESLGQLGRLYVGSWSAWSNTEGLPIATGEEPANPADR